MSIREQDRPLLRPGRIPFRRKRSTPARSSAIGPPNAKTATFSLDLTPDEKFTWKYDRQGTGQEFGGKYAVDGAILVLQRADGAQMPGLVTLANNGFNFKLYGGPPDDPGLDFKK
jgi:hypothetical protein